MTIRAYYNEVDPYCAQWLRNLISAGLITPGDVDTRSIVDVRPADVAGYDRCHFFAGIAGWERALELAEWGDAPVWTGSCPCQPFSAAGRQEGFRDERHLWPAWFELIRECRPAVVFGEQVEAAVRLGWLDAVFADLEGEDYACGAAVLGAHSVGAPHIRQRLWFVANTRSFGRFGRPDTSRSARQGAAKRVEGASVVECGCDAVLVGDAERQRVRGEGRGADDGAARGVPDPDGQWERLRPDAGPAGRLGFWSDLIWLPCRDGKARPTQSGIQPLAYGVSARVGKLRAAGNAIVPQVAATFIGAYLEASAPTPSTDPASGEAAV